MRWLGALRSFLVRLKWLCLDGNKLQGCTRQGRADATDEYTAGMEWRSLPVWTIALHVNSICTSMTRFSFQCLVTAIHHPLLYPHLLRYLTSLLVSKGCSCIVFAAPWRPSMGAKSSLSICIPTSVLEGGGAICQWIIYSLLYDNERSSRLADRRYSWHAADVSLSLSLASSNKFETRFFLVVGLTWKNWGCNHMRV